MSVQRTQYSIDDSVATMPVPMTHHAIDMYHERLPDTAVRPPVAWRRGEDIQHPEVAATNNDQTPPPSRVRVYNHDQRYYAIFICSDAWSEEAVVTVYGGQTHEHGPTRAYLHSHGPHFGGGEGDE